MSDSRMKYLYKVPYDRIDLMLGSLKPGKYYKAWAAIMQYAHDTETGDLNVPVPVTGDPSIDGFVRVMCGDVRDKTKANFEKVFPANKRNAETRWSNEAEAKADHDKGKGKRKGKAAKQDKAEGEAEAGEAKQDEPKTNGPMTFDQFVGLAGPGVDDKKLKALYNDLEAANWIYHGFDLREYYTKCTDHYKSAGGKWRCGLLAVIAYNAHPNYTSDKKRFDAICDLAIEQGWEGGLCSVCETMKKTKSYSIDGVRYEGHEYDSVEKFIEFLKNF